VQDLAHSGASVPRARRRRSTCAKPGRSAWLIRRRRASAAASECGCYHSARLASDLSELPVLDGFRMRGESVSRLETFVDAAFAFAVTLMVISSGEMPRSPGELLTALHRMPTFAASFAILMIFWSSHNRWSRRFGLETARTTFLGFLLVFVVLVWVFPLRAVMGSAMTAMTNGWVPSEFNISSNSEMSDCFIVYGLGFGALSGILLLLDRAAIDAADELRLDTLERLEARRDLWSHGILLGFAVLSIVLTFFTRERQDWLGAMSGFVYMGIGPAMHFHHARFHKLRKALPARAG